MHHDRSNLLGLGYFVHPVPVAAVLLLVLNDHLLKARYPGFFTGKLSDFAGVFFFPIFLCAVVGLVRRLAGRQSWLTPQGLLVAILLCDVVFVSVKVFPAANQLYAQVLFALGFPSRLVLDATDLSALAMNPLTYLYGRSFWETEA